MLMALEHLIGRPSVIVEIGSSAWGTNSSLLFDSYVNSFGGIFQSVDLRVQPMLSLQKSVQKKAISFAMIPLIFCKNLSTKRIKLIYVTWIHGM